MPRIMSLPRSGGRGLVWGLGFLVSGRSQVAVKDGKNLGFLMFCVNRFWTTRFSTWLGEVSVSGLVAESKVNAPQKHILFGFFLYTFVVLSAAAIFINSCCVRCPKCRCWNSKIIFRSKHRWLQPVRFFTNLPEIMQSYRVLQDTHYYILLTVGTGIQVSGRFKKN